MRVLAIFIWEWVASKILGMGSEQDARTTRIVSLLTLRFKCQTAYRRLRSELKTAIALTPYPQVQPLTPAIVLLIVLLFPVPQLPVLAPRLPVLAPR